MPTLPSLAADVWALFIRLHKKRQAGMDGPLRLPTSEVQAHVTLFGLRVSVWQLNLIDKLEDIYFEVRVQRERNKPKKDVKKQGQRER